MRIHKTGMTDIKTLNKWIAQLIYAAFCKREEICTKRLQDVSIRPTSKVLRTAGGRANALGYHYKTEISRLCCVVSINPSKWNTTIY